MSLQLEGSDFIRERVVLAILSGKQIRIKHIRSENDNPGLLECEISFLRLVEKITEGSSVEINHTGTSFSFRPGILKGGQIEHSCHISKGVGYYLEPLVPIAPFSKFALKLTLTGITTKVCLDPSVDVLRIGYLPLLKHYGIEDSSLIELKIKKRGAFPLGGGEVYFTCPVIKTSVPFSLLTEGKVLKVRGIATTMRISPQVANRLVESSRSVLNTFLNDIYIHTDVFKGAESGNSPGYNLALLAETTKGCLFFYEAAGQPQQAPEDIGISVSKGLLTKIKMGGCVDPELHRMLLLMIACGPEDLFKVKLCAISEETFGYMSELERFLGVSFKVVQAEEGNSKTNGEVIVSAFGAGFVNFAKREQ